MIIYNCIVCLGDKYPITDQMEALIRSACLEASSRQNAIRKGRKYEFNGLSSDRIHFRLTLTSDSEVIPSRAMSAVTRSLIDLDKDRIFDSHWSRNMLFITKPVENSDATVTTLTDVELLKEITDMLFNQASMGTTNRRLAKQTAEELKEIMISYISQKSVI